MLCLILKHFVSAFIALVIGRSQLLIDLHISHLSSAHARLCRTCGSRLSCRTYLVRLSLSDLSCQTYLVRLILRYSHVDHCRTQRESLVGLRSNFRS